MEREELAEYRALRDAVDKFMEDGGLTDEQMAYVLGIDAEMLRGPNGSWPSEAVYTLAQILNVSVDDLLEDRVVVG